MELPSVMGFDDIPEGIEIPDKLYHGTSTRHLDSIERTGLGNTMEKNWPHLLKMDYTVHLSDSPKGAELWAEMWTGPRDILILEIDTASLDRNSLFYDNQSKGAYVYRGIINNYKVVS
jgi:RNA:NAD 2'-phosphotransferase (TPT1/KptA family)